MTMNKYSLIIANYCLYQAERWWIGEQVDTVLLTYRSDLLKSVRLKNNMVMVLSGMVFARKIARMILIQNL